MPAKIYKNKDDKRVPGVTTIIGQNLGWSKGGLMHWAWEQGINGLDYRDTRDGAATTGTIAHAMVENEVKGIKFDWPGLAYKYNATPKQIKQAESAFAAFVRWKERVKFELVFAEHKLVSETYQYGGQLDLAAVQGRLALIDIKTSDNIYPDHIIQVAGYDNLWTENYPEKPIQEHYILRLGKNGGFSDTFIAEAEIEDGFRAFVLLRELHDLKKKL